MRWLLSALGYALLTCGAMAQSLVLPGPGLPVASGGTPIPTFVQGNTLQNGAGSVTSAAVVLPSTVGVGHMVIAVLCSANMLTTDTITMTDDKANVYTIVFASPVINAGASFGCDLGYFLNATNGPKTITASNSNARTFLSVVAEEWSNVLTSAAVDGTPASASQNSAGTGANAIKTANVTTTANGDLVWGFSVSINSTGLSVGTGFTAHQAVTSTYYTESLIQGAAGAIPATFTATSGTDNNITFTIAFKHS